MFLCFLLHISHDWKLQDKNLCHFLVHEPNDFCSLICYSLTAPHDKKFIYTDTFSYMINLRNSIPSSSSRKKPCSHLPSPSRPSRSTFSTVYPAPPPPSPPRHPPPFPCQSTYNLHTSLCRPLLLALHLPATLTWGRRTSV